jgi:hypothetical protein
VAEEVPAQDESEATGALVVQSGFWRLVSEILAGVWVLTVLAWWWSSRRPESREAKEPEAPPIHKQQAKLLKAARKAALADDAAGVKTALLQWSRLQWPENPPRSVGALATRVSIPLSAQLMQLCSASYGSRDEVWDNEALAKSLRSFSVLQEGEEEQATDILPPLSPVTGSPSL